jgi:prefoldin subunit 5
MANRRHLIALVLVTSCLLVTLFGTIPTWSSQSVPEYNPWLDLDDNGKVNIMELLMEAKSFGASGDPINKTALLYNVNDTFTSLLSRIDSSNASLIDLRNRVAALENSMIPNASLIELSSKIDSLNASLLDVQNRATSVEGRASALETTVNQLENNITMLQGSINSLDSAVTILESTVATLQTNFAIMNASIASLNDRVSALEANYSVTNLDLAPYAIPFTMTYSDLHNFTTETNDYVDMPYTSVTMALNRTSRMLIMFSCNAAVSSATVNEHCYIKCQALVNTTAAYPNSIELTPTMSVEIGSPYTHAHRIYNATCCFNFYTNQLSAGTYTITMKWYLSSQGTGDVYSRTLIVIALPT